MNFQSHFKKLKQLKLVKPDKLLSMYLNTDRRHPDQQGGEWKILLKNGFNRLEEYMEASNEEEKMNLQIIRDKVETYLFSQERHLPRSIILFASAGGVWECLELQIPVETSFYWEETPMLEPLHLIYDQYPLTGLILLQQNQVKVLETALGELFDQKFYEYDLDTEDWKKYAGPVPSSRLTGGKASQKDLFQERIKMNQERWLKSLGSELDKRAADGRWEKIVLVGDKEEAAILCSNMNKKIDFQIQKNLLNHSEYKVLDEVMV